MAAASVCRYRRCRRYRRHRTLTAESYHRISLFRLANAIFELRIHLHLSHHYSPHSGDAVIDDVELTPNGEYLLVSGSVQPSVGGGAYTDIGAADNMNDKGTLMWTDQPYGRFGRSVHVRLSPGTEVRASFIPFMHHCS